MKRHEVPRDVLNLLELYGYEAVMKDLGVWAIKHKSSGETICGYLFDSGLVNYCDLLLDRIRLFEAGQLI